MVSLSARTGSYLESHRSVMGTCSYKYGGVVTRTGDERFMFKDPAEPANPRFVTRMTATSVQLVPPHRLTTHKMGGPPSAMERITVLCRGALSGNMPAEIEFLMVTDRRNC